jgi:hypothetical protein
MEQTIELLLRIFAGSIGPTNRLPTNAHRERALTRGRLEPREVCHHGGEIATAVSFEDSAFPEPSRRHLRGPGLVNAPNTSAGHARALGSLDTRCRMKGR